ncbi:helix-turn-helix domain-containing protein [Sphingobium sp. CECT 9361]|uniref:helix-turn-helix domain-containing protein n=1 Tax=Sphingobium sp. CECT 9361 TaxID=2845384 RepID=UPI001E2993F0|nr:helix-turn-helix domain-containing protein [Sphingobium sp. CECT 9361]
MDGVLSSQEKWGLEAIAAGFTVLPNHFLALNQFVEEEKSLSPTEMIVMLQILSAWWSKDRLPFPSKATIATRSGLSPRQVQRAITSLEKKEYIERISRYSTNQGRTSNQFKLTGLVGAVMKAAKEHPAAFKRQSPSKPKVEEEVL